MNSPSFDLSGIWIDSGSEIIITHTGNTVRAEWVKEYECDPRDGTPIQKTKLDFEATITGNQLEGQTSACTYRIGFVTGTFGIILTDLKLTISADGEELVGLPPDGGYFNLVSKQWEALTITRKSYSTLKDQLAAAQPNWEEYCGDESKDLRGQLKALQNVMANLQTADRVMSLRRVYDDLNNRWELLKEACAAGGFDIDGLDGTDPPVRIQPRTPKEQKQRDEEDARRQAEDKERYQHLAEAMRELAQEDRKYGNTLENMISMISLMTIVVEPELLVSPKLVLNPELATHLLLDVGVDVGFEIFEPGEAMAKAWEDNAKTWQKAADSIGSPAP